MRCLEDSRIWDKLKSFHWSVSSLGEGLSPTDGSFEHVKRTEDFKLLDKLAQEEQTGENAIRLSCTNRERIFCMVSKKRES